MSLFSDPLTYLFHPNPGNAGYESPKSLALLALCILLVFASVGLRLWRRNLKNPVTRKLSRSWPSAAMWFGVLGILFVVSRVETVGYLSMRFLWVLWIVAFIMYLWIQWKLFRMRHYTLAQKEPLPQDPRDTYLPKKKRR